MRILSRNKQEMWFANPDGIERVTDENGLYTGEKQNVYSKPEMVKMSLAISSGANNLGSQGMADLEPYGVVTGYTHRAVTEDLNCTMQEQSIIWTEALDESIWSGMTDEEWHQAQVTNPLPKYRFRVVRKAKSLNHLIYYLKEVDVG